MAAGDELRRAVLDSVDVAEGDLDGHPQDRHPDARVEAGDLVGKREFECVVHVPARDRLPRSVADDVHGVEPRAGAEHGLDDRTDHRVLNHTAECRVHLAAAAQHEDRPDVRDVPARRGRVRGVGVGPLAERTDLLARQRTGSQGTPFGEERVGDALYVARVQGGQGSGKMANSDPERDRLKRARTGSACPQ